MAAEQDVEALLPDGRRHRVTDEEDRVTPGQLGAGLVDHARGEIDPGDPVALLGRYERQAAGAAAHVEQVTGRLGQPVPQPGDPGTADLGIAQPVVGLLVERAGFRVPVDARPCIRTAVAHHAFHDVTHH